MSTPRPEPSGDLAIRVSGLRKSYQGGRVHAVAGLDLAIPRGGVHGFLGPNGSGKTTTLRMLLGLIRPDEGTMEIFGRQVPQELPEVISRVGAIVEAPRFFPTMSARTNLTLLAEGIGTSRARVSEVLDAVGLSGRANDAVRTYSLGMKQRLAIACTLLKDPELLIFDEPTNGLDPAGISEIRQTIRGLAGQGRTVIVSSHLLSEVQQVADTVTIIARGRTLREGRVTELLSAGPAAVRLVIEDPAAAAKVLTDAALVVENRPDGALRITQPDGSVVPERVAQTLAGAGLWPRELGPEHENLEEYFLQLTSREHLSATQSDGGSVRRAMGGAA